jgi:hypothetical protein
MEKISGASAFTALESVSGDKVTNIGAYAFYGCSKLTSADFPAATNIGEGAFFNCGALTSVYLPAALTIQNRAFLYCYGLNSVDLPKVTSIGDEAFRTSYALTIVTIGPDCDASSIASFPNEFKGYYDDNGKLAGVYTWNGTAWNYAP